MDFELLPEYLHGCMIHSWDGREPDWVFLRNDDIPQFIEILVVCEEVNPLK